ncbi:hypothetical protein [Hymenobacter sp. UYCo722]|uniref:hypothetical protein n=1 Tax=Hymenobacter sp. UYCo722 TaxID=3156335 RepID=UPI003397B5A2
MMKYFPTGLNCLFALVCLAGSGCSLGHSVSDDLKSTNPAVVLQAQKVIDLQQQVDAQEKSYNNQKDAVKDRERAVEKQKDEADIEKKRLEALQNQLDGAKQNLKGVKTQAKTQ